MEAPDHEMAGCTQPDKIDNKIRPCIAKCAENVYLQIYVCMYVCMYICTYYVCTGWIRTAAFLAIVLTSGKNSDPAKNRLYTLLHPI
jgi:hypothetical protein